MTEEEALAVVDQASEDTCSCCRQPYAAHCQQCWSCRGTHDEMCGF